VKRLHTFQATENPGILIDSRGSLEDAVGFIREVDPSVVLGVATCAPVGAPAPWAQGEGIAAADVARWEEEWPDQPAFARECLTPSQAWYCLDGHTLLELALRDLEFHAGRVRREGRPAPDMALLRERLHMRRKDSCPPRRSRPHPGSDGSAAGACARASNPSIRSRQRRTTASRDRRLRRPSRAAPGTGLPRAALRPLVTDP
jgi:hypothetical protein